MSNDEMRQALWGELNRTWNGPVSGGRFDILSLQIALFPRNWSRNLARATVPFSGLTAESRKGKDCPGKEVRLLAKDCGALIEDRCRFDSNWLAHQE